MLQVSPLASNLSLDNFIPDLCIYQGITRLGVLLWGLELLELFGEQLEGARGSLLQVLLKVFEIPVSRPLLSNLGLAYLDA